MELHTVRRVDGAAATVRANGAVVGPLVILAIAMFPVRFGLANLFEPMLGSDAIWWSFPAGSLASMVMTIAYYRYGNWRKGRNECPGGQGRVRGTGAGRGATDQQAMPVG